MRNTLLLAICLSALSVDASAAVVKTLGGATYEFLELSATETLLRADIEIELQDPGSSLYGYEYASRALVEELLLSYASWDGLNGLHTNSAVIAGVSAFMNDFGQTNSGSPNGILEQYSAVDGSMVVADYSTRTNFIYGQENECGMNISCLGGVITWYDTAGNALAASQLDFYGWNSSADAALYLHEFYDADPAEPPYTPSLLVRTSSVSAVPIPAAFWLFVSALAGLNLVRRNTVLRH
jgi:hypothetical protein